MNLHSRLKAMLETFLKDNYSKTYIDDYNFVFCTSFSIHCIVLFFVFTVLVRSDSGFYTLNWIEFQLSHGGYRHRIKFQSPLPQIGGQGSEAEQFRL